MAAESSAAVASTGLIRQQPQETAMARMATTPEFITNIEKMGGWLHESGMFGCKHPAQGKVLALACAVTGQDPFKLMAENMIVEGKLTRKYDMMLVDLRRASGDYEWIEDGENGIQSTLAITWRGKTHRYTYTMDMAKRAGVIKPGSGWEKRPGNMLRSKAVRNGLQMYAPEVLGGTLTPEDAEEIASDVASQSTVSGPTQAEREARAAELRRQAAVSGQIHEMRKNGTTNPDVAPQQPASGGDVINAEFTVATATVATPAATTETPEMVDTSAEPGTDEPTPEPPARISPDVITKITDLAKKLGMTREQFAAGLQRNFGHQDVNAITTEQGERMLAKFQETYNAKVNQPTKVPF